jgi:hypothetical protein
MPLLHGTDIVAVKVYSSPLKRFIQIRGNGCNVFIAVWDRGHCETSAVLVGCTMPCPSTVGKRYDDGVDGAVPQLAVTDSANAINTFACVSVTANAVFAIDFGAAAKCCVGWMGAHCNEGEDNANTHDGNRCSTDLCRDLDHSSS